MKIHALAVRGVGPYKDEFFIDFDKLADRGIFLIDGETGAGKSTIIDAISYALYGRVAAPKADASNRIRSRFLTPKDGLDASRVELIFSESDKAYYIKRNPAYSHPKKGHPDAPESDWKKESEAVQLKELDQQRFREKQLQVEAVEDVGEAGKKLVTFAQNCPLPDGAVSSDNVREVNGAIIPDLVGLTAEQFYTVICLPQGKFETFLRAKPDDRSTMLIDIFHLGIYDEIQNALKAMEDEKNDDIDRSIHALHDAVSQLLGVLRTTEGLKEELEQLADWNDEGGSAKDVLALLSVDSLQDHCDELDGILEGIARNLAHARQMRQDIRQAALAERDEANADEACAQKLLEDLRKQRDLVAKKSELDARRPDIDDEKRRIGLAHAAQPVASAQRIVAETMHDVEKKQSELQTISAKLDGMGSENDLKEQLAACQKAQIEAVEHEAEKKQCALLLDRFAELEKSESDLASARAKVKAAQDKRDEARTTLDSLGDPDEIKAGYEKANGLVKTKEAVRAELDSAKAALDDFARRTQLQDDLEDLQKAVDEAHDEYQKADERYNQARIDSKIAELGAVLEDGRPCPVCGSVDHPAPHAAATVDVENCAAERIRRKQTWEDATARLNAHVATLQVVSESLEGKTVEDAEARRDSAQRSMLMIEDCEKRLDDLKAACDDVDAAQKGLEKADNDVQKEQVRLDARLEDVARRRAECAGQSKDGLAERIAVLDAQIADDKQFAGRLESVNARLSARRETEKLENSCAEVLKQKRNDLATAQGRLASAVSDNGFESLDAALAAVIEHDELTRLDASVRQYEAEAKSVDDQLEASNRDTRGHLAADGARALRLISVGAVPDDAALYRRDASGEPQMTHLGAAIAAIDRDELLGRKAKADQAYDVANSAFEAAGASYGTFDESRAVVREAAQAWKKSREDAWPYQYVSRLLRGIGGKGNDNSSRLTISAYAAQQIFIAVLEQANAILGEIHNGTYQLYLGHSQKGNSKQGLPIEVYDARTGRRGAADTLSGGETFFISLALSLGLARVVQAQGRKVDMDVFFIDEGFGTLSEDYLNDVIHELTRLSEQGRVIGIISHVADLQERIGTQIKVSRKKGLLGQDRDSEISFEL